jgi:hypothetical protein
MENLRHQHDLEKLQKEVEAGKYADNTSTGTKTAAGKDIKLTQEQMDNLIKRNTNVNKDPNNVDKESETKTEETKTEEPESSPEPPKIRKSSETGIPDDTEEKTSEKQDAVSVTINPLIVK